MLQLHRKNQSAPAFIPDFGDPLGLLVHCHAKIEAQLGALDRATRLLRAGDAAAIPAALAAVEAAQAHFAGPGVKHTADEEESLFPRLRLHVGPSEGRLLDALDELEAQHRVADRAHADLDAVVARLAAGGAPSEVDVDELDACVEPLVALYGPHILLEDRIVFTTAARVLPPDELLAVGREMRARRSIHH